MPRFISGRVHMSLEEKLKVILTPDGLVQPAPWASGDPNSGILFDCSDGTVLRVLAPGNHYSRLVRLPAGDSHYEFVYVPNWNFALD